MKKILYYTDSINNIILFELMHKLASDYTVIIALNLNKLSKKQIDNIDAIASVYKKIIFKTFNTNTINFIIEISRIVRNERVTLITTFSFKYALIVKALNFKVKFLYINGHPTISNSRVKTIIFDSIKWLNIMTFKHQIIVNESIIKKFKPLSSRYIKINPFHKSHTDLNKEFDYIKLLYIGSLNNRNIHLTIEGVKYFLKKHQLQLEYIIIGTGDIDSVSKLKHTIEVNQLHTNIKYLGWQPDKVVSEYINYCNIGVSFCPVTPKYINNMSNKTYEYLLSGMPIIATKLNENIKVVNETNGVLIDDTAQGFCDGLNVLLNQLKTYDSYRIKNTVAENSVEFIADNSVKPYINKIING